MDEQRRRAEFAGSGEVAVEGIFQDIADRVGATTFLGYEATEADSAIVALVADGASVTSVDRAHQDARSAWWSARPRSTASRAARWATPGPSPAPAPR